MVYIVFACRMYGTSERRPIGPQRVDAVFFVRIFMIAICFFIFLKTELFFSAYMYVDKKLLIQVFPLRG